MKKGIVSVIIPIYKVEKFLRICLESVINQTYKNLEIILVDDGSPDNCGEICDEYASKDSRIKVIHKENGGLSDARNAGIEVATGEYITFVDSDDFLFLNMVEILYQLCKKNRAEFSMCQCVHCTEKDEKFMMEKSEIQEKIEIFEEKEKMKAYMVSKKIDTVVWKKMYAKRLFDNIRFPKGKLHEDTFVMHLLIESANKVVITNEYGYVYRINPESIMNRNFSSKRLDAIEAHVEKKDFMEKNYPELYSYACSELIYACNFCLYGMVIADYYEQTIEDMLKVLYRKYAKYYIFSLHTSYMGKVLSVIAFINLSLARLCIRVIEKRRDQK